MEFAICTAGLGLVSPGFDLTLLFSPFFLFFLFFIIELYSFTRNDLPYK